MSQNTYKESVVRLAKQIKKEHFIKLGLWIAGISLTLIWLAMVLATSISTGDRIILDSANEMKFEANETNKTIIEAYLQDYKNFRYSITFEGAKSYIIIKPILKWVDLNPMCLTYDSSLIGWYICILLAPIGYMGIIYIIAYMKNMITPSKIKQVVRKSLQFGYLKQQDVEYVVNEIDYNIGLKQRPTEINKQEKENDI